MRLGSPSPGRRDGPHGARRANLTPEKERRWFISRKAAWNERRLQYRKIIPYQGRLHSLQLQCVVKAAFAANT